MPGVWADDERCYRAVQSKDARFDGWFVGAVLTTGIYCRPSCPVRPPKQENIRFYRTAATAQQAGFRACKRCSPDASPGSPEWTSRADVVARAMRLIADGVVDREGVGGLARQLGYSTRQIERLLVAEVGTGPLALARAERARTARVLIETTDLRFIDLAFAAGFSSVRQFNDTVRDVFALTPKELRQRSRSNGRRAAPGELALRLPFRTPFEPSNVFGHLASTAVPGVEEIRGDTYRRVLRLPHGTGIVELSPRSDHVDCRLSLDDLKDLPTAVARCRRLLDLDADPEAVDAALIGDPALRDTVAGAPGRRVRRSIDEQEMAIRAVLGQQISTAAATTHAARLVRRLGPPVDDPVGCLTNAFPSAQELLELDPEHLGLPQARRRSLIALTEALADGSLELGAGADWTKARADLLALPGIGPWTTEIIAMRVLGDPDAFPSSDLAVLRGAANLGIAGTPATLDAHAERWRPWRSYAAQHLWAATDHPIIQWPPSGPTHSSKGNER